MIITKHLTTSLVPPFSPWLILERGKVIPLDFTSGMIVVLKPTQSPFSMSSEAMPTFKPKPIHLDLYNQNGDILLRITFDRGMLGRNHKKICNDCSHKSLDDSWGKAQKWMWIRASMDGMIRNSQFQCTIIRLGPHSGDMKSCWGKPPYYVTSINIFLNEERS